MAVGQPSPDVRRANFSKFVARALQRAQARGLTVPQIEAATGISKTTFYRWRSGDWSRDPRASEVRGFCEGLGESLRAAHSALGWTTSAPAEPEPQLDPDIAFLARRLADPAVPAAEKAIIRGAVRQLANLGGEDPPPAPRRRRPA